MAATARHLLVPRWWEADGEGADWGGLRDGPSDRNVWMEAAYSDRTLVTQAGDRHADHARPGERCSGWPTSSATLPSLVVRMLRHLEVFPGAAVLDVATGSGYSAALLSRLLEDELVTSIDVDPYLTEMAAERLDQMDLRPKVVTCDATGTLPGEFDGIVSMVSVRPVPASWLAALRPGGRLVTVISGTSLIITANKREDGGATGTVERDRAMFMKTRHGTDYPPEPAGLWIAAFEQEGEEVTTGRYPMVNVSDAWELRSMLEVVCPGIEHRYRESSDDGRQTAWMAHPDGSWARASAIWDELPTVRQGGPRRLWDTLDEVRHHWMRNGELPLLGSKVSIDPTGKIMLSRGWWKATIT
ncbi:protein-L-isoaspartate O-methyltransferase [Sphaerisporangium siamense]|uniref:Protein-L-isoaspartate O-methyltransferase n=1 Tax=Sphaerisporangium siamense TaxID=795645 RepID=A0A7W7DBW7_9ACTN|nr:methyltransferase domain-containing protein [Sphaerisporangium siamense]MBB4702816.1 protein-L-isoaspartate O-methyltransferase [Sphaerisporangium siamense]GII83428.1 protein-L-isoaspartate O-methyltransferase [Sphaerisporangium siamense]